MENDFFGFNEDGTLQEGLFNKYSEAQLIEEEKRRLQTDQQIEDAKHAKIFEQNTKGWTKQQIDELTQTEINRLRGFFELNLRNWTRKFNFTRWEEKFKQDKTP